MRALPFRLLAYRQLIQIMGWVSAALAGWLALRVFSRPHSLPEPGWETELVARGTIRTFANSLVGVTWAPRDPAKARWVLLLHGWQGRGTQLGKLVDPLLGKGYHVIALDAPAHGRSPGVSTNINHLATSLHEIAFELGGLECVIAHSFGAGAVGLALTRGLPCKRAVLVASPTDLVLIAENYSKRMRLSRQVFAEFQRQLEAWQGFKLNETNLAVLGRTIQTPVLVVHDPEDKEVRYQNAILISENWPRARLLTLRQVGHYRILKAPDFISAILQFLAEV